jgi:hypothetical protein
MTKGLRKRRVRTEAHRRLLGPAPLIAKRHLRIKYGVTNVTNLRIDGVMRGVYAL